VFGRERKEAKIPSVARDARDRIEIGGRLFICASALRHSGLRRRDDSDTALPGTAIVFTLITS
jgi:hypothetical protein